MKESLGVSTHKETDPHMSYKQKAGSYTWAASSNIKT